MPGEPVIPAPDPDDDDDVAWALQTAAVQWQRGQRADAVVWLRRAVDASISAGRAERTRELTRLAASVADRLVSEAMAVPDSTAPPRRETESDVDELLARPSAVPRSARSRGPSHSASDIPVEFDADDAELIEDDFEDDLADEDADDADDRAPTLPPRVMEAEPTFRHELTSREYEYEDPSGSYVDAESVYEEDTSTHPVHEAEYEHVDDDDTESLVDATELLSDRPPAKKELQSARPRSPSNRPAPDQLSSRFLDRSPVGRGNTYPGGFGVPRNEPSPPTGSRPPGGGARGSERAPASSGRPLPNSTGVRGSDRAPVSSGRPAPASTAARGSDRAPTSSGRPSASAAGRGSERAPTSSGRPAPSNAAGRGSARPASVAGARGTRPPSDRSPSAPPSSGNRGPLARPSSSPPPERPSSDRPMEPIVTAEELFRQKALENARKSEPPGPSGQVSGAPSEPPSGPPIVDGVSLESVRGFEDLPEATQQALARSASLTTLSTDDEVGSFGAALVTRGRVGIMPAIADVASSVAKPGEIVFTRGTLGEGVALRVVALESNTTVASWSEETLGAAMADCPWVADELRLVADRFQSEAGAVLGPLGERLDDVLRDTVMSRLEVKSFAPGEIIVREGKPVPGLHVVGGGRVELLTVSGAVSDAGPGEFLFAAEVLGGRKAHVTARAGKGGALVLFAPRSVAHELLLSVPTLIEILSD